LERDSDGWGLFRRRKIIVHSRIIIIGIECVGGLKQVKVTHHGLYASAMFVWKKEIVFML
jgi:hypothetical protein